MGVYFQYLLMDYVGQEEIPRSIILLLLVPWREYQQQQKRLNDEGGRGTPKSIQNDQDTGCIQS